MISHAIHIAIDCEPTSPSPTHMYQLTETLDRIFNLITGESDLVSVDPVHAANSNADQALSLIGQVITDKDLPHQGEHTTPPLPSEGCGHQVYCY